MSGNHNDARLPPPRPVTFGYNAANTKKSVRSPIGKARNHVTNLNVAPGLCS
jgi:hypothetical protein